MAETNVRLRYCKECGEHTEYDYMGKGKTKKPKVEDSFAVAAAKMALGMDYVPEKVEDSFAVAAAKRALGMDRVPEKLFDDRPRLYKCKKCGHISQG